MPDRPRHQVPLQIFIFVLFLCLLLWNLGAGILPASTFQNQEHETPADTPAATVSPSETSGTVTPVDTPRPSETESTSTSTPASAETAGSPSRFPLPAIFAAGAYAPDELVVRFKSSTRSSRIDECFQGTDIQIQTEIEELHTYVLTVVSGDIPGAYYHVLDCAGSLYVEPNFLLQAADTIPNDPDWSLQYGLVNIRAPQGWDLSTGSAAMIIGIVDTGVDYSHPDLAGKLLSGYDFVNNDDNPQDDNGHGTHVAGIAAASSNNSLGVAGVSWGARILPVKVLNATGSGTYANTAAGVIWAVDHGAQVINLSLGGTGPSSILEDAVDYAHSHGAILVAAAGNAGTNFVLYPARYPNVVAVARTDSANHWDGSNYGPEVDLSAPGTSIYSTVIGGYDYKSGSSMSTGFVSGLAAVLMGVSGNTSPDAIESDMESTALDIESVGRDDYTGAGLIQMDAALRLAAPPVQPPSGQNGPPAGPGPGSILDLPTNSPTPTWTLSPTLPTQTETSTLPSEPVPTGTFTAIIALSPTGSADEVQAQGEAGRRNYLLPCTGLVLILLGVLLFLAFRRK